MSKVSVIIPMFNPGQYVKENIDSISQQGFKDLEIIYVNDGSTDLSEAYVKQRMADDSRIKLYEQDRKGAGTARNLGLTMATGEYCVFLDADDFFDVSFIEKMYQRIVFTGADICVCNYDKYDEQTKVTTHRDFVAVKNVPAKDSFSYHDFPEVIFNTFQNAPWNKMYRRRFLEEKCIRFQEIPRANDLYFTNIALIHAKKISFVHEPLVTYRLNTDNSIQNTIDSIRDEFLIAFVKLKEELVRMGCYDEVKQSFANKVVSDCDFNLAKLYGTEWQHELFSRLHDEYFPLFDIADKGEDYFYNKNLYRKMIRYIIDFDEDGYLRARFGEKTVENTPKVPVLMVKFDYIRRSLKGNRKNHDE